MCQRTGSEAFTRNNLSRLHSQVGQSDPDHGRKWERALAGADRSHPAAGREHEPAGLDVVRTKVRGPRPLAHNVRYVVVADEQPTRVDVEGLPSRVGVEMLG